MLVDTTVDFVDTAGGVPLVKSIGSEVEYCEAEAGFTKGRVSTTLVVALNGSSDCKVGEELDD